MNYNYQGIRQISSDVKLTGSAESDPAGMEVRDADAPRFSVKSLRYPLAFILLVILGISFGGDIISHYSVPPVKKPSIFDSNSFDDSGRYVVRNFDDKKPSANFLASLGGLWGVPMVRLI
jgi:hypothetical protein